MRSAETERADVIAYLERKRANAETMAQRSPEFADEGRWSARQIGVLIDDLRAGLHEGLTEPAGTTPQAAFAAGSGQ